jgi:hypothetical protein
MKNPSSTTEELIGAVHAAFDQYEFSKLNYAFLTLQCSMNSIIDCGGYNSYKILHMGKGKLEREGLLPISIHATTEANEWVTRNDNLDDLEIDVEDDDDN